MTVDKSSVDFSCRRVSHNPPKCSSHTSCLFVRLYSYGGENRHACANGALYLCCRMRADVTWLTFHKITEVCRSQNFADIGLSSPICASLFAGYREEISRGQSTRRLLLRHTTQCRSGLSGIYLARRYKKIRLQKQSFSRASPSRSHFLLPLSFLLDKMTEAQITRDLEAGPTPSPGKLAWEDIKYTVKDRKTKQQVDLLDRVSGQCLVGQMLASESSGGHGYPDSLTHGMHSCLPRSPRAFRSRQVYAARLSGRTEEV